MKPAIYEGGKYQTDRRWWGPVDDRTKVDVVVIDNVPSQANRLDAALRTFRSRLGLPEFVLDLNGVPGLSLAPTAHRVEFSVPAPLAETRVRPAFRRSNQVACAMMTLRLSAAMFATDALVCAVMTFAPVARGVPIIALDPLSIVVTECFVFASAVALTVGRLLRHWLVTTQTQNMEVEI